MKDMTLGQRVAVPDSYDPSILYAMPRRNLQPGVYGFDLWRCYELSWLGPRGKPETAVLEIVYPVESKNIVESKSLKLYLAGLSNESFPDPRKVECIIRGDLEEILLAPWIDTAIFMNERGLSRKWMHSLLGICIDGIDIEISHHGLDPNLLHVQEGKAHQSLVSHLLRTYCPITHQPDFASALIKYKGKKIDPASLLRYLCSYRQHEGFSEECCEQIYMDILSRCTPDELTVACFYTRRGGIDINPVRSSHEIGVEDMRRYRLVRQ